MKTVKRRAKSAALEWKEFGLTAGYHSHTAPAAKGSYYISPTFEREVFNAYLVSQLEDCEARDYAKGLVWSLIKTAHLEDWRSCRLHVRDQNGKKYS